MVMRIIIKHNPKSKLRYYVNRGLPPTLPGWAYSKTCLKWPLSKRAKIGFQDQLSLNAGQKYCRMLPLEHSAILLTFIELPFVIKIFVLSIFEWPLKIGLLYIRDPAPQGQLTLLQELLWYVTFYFLLACSNMNIIPGSAEF